MLKCQDLHEGDSPRRDVFLLPLGFLIHALGEEPATPGHCSWIPHLFLVQAYIPSLTLLTAGLSWPGKPRSVIKDIIYFSPVIPDLEVTLRSLVCPHANHLPTPSHWGLPAPFRNLEPKVLSTQKAFQVCNPSLSFTVSKWLCHLLLEQSVSLPNDTYCCFNFILFLCLFNICVQL